MRSKKGILIAIAIAILIITGLVLTWIDLMNREEPRELSVAEQFVDDFLRKYQQKDPRAGLFLMTSALLSNPYMTFYGFQGYMADTLTYTIIGERGDDLDIDFIFVDVEIEVVDLAELARTIENTTETNPDVLLETLRDLVTSPNAPRRTFQVPIIVQEFQVGMFIEMNAELSDALIGGLNTYVFDIMEGW
ncbi:MAG: hypothetical protein FWC75_07465 [Oscillospiraceae bacterium]|nr:hypothetical protein [Oscillospiraceae bacterium]